MANLIARTDFSQAKSGSTVNFTITLSQPATAGSTLIVYAAGGAVVTCKINNSSGAAFNVRTNLVSGQGLSIADFVCAGGETAVYLTLNGAENIAGTIYELGTGLTFVSASNSGGAVVPGNSNDWQSEPTVANLGANAKGVLVGGWSVTATLASTPFSATNQWRQMGPVGRLYVNAGLQPGANTQFIYASGLADITNTVRYPLNNSSAGDYRATSVWNQTSGSTYAVQALYADTSGVATVAAYPNSIVAENTLPGTHTSNWFVGKNGTNANIAGFADKNSYLPGDTVNFKVDSGNGAFRVEIYRLGYYGWDSFGARLMTGNGAGYITGTPAVQPAPTVDGTLGSTSCAAWSTTATWAIPSGTPSGVYYVLFRSTVTPANVSSGHFIIQSATTTNKVAAILPNLTYQAYNVWGATSNSGDLVTGTWSGRSLYASGSDGNSGNLAHRGYGVSFDRPYSTQSTQPNTYLFDTEQGLIHFFEAEGYDMIYFSDTDLDSNAALLNTTSLVMVLGHHEYWTTGVYNCLINAMDNKVNTFFCSSNTALWHVRFAAGDTNRRTSICYKESATQDVSAGWSGTGFDPVSYTGAWRDTRTGGSLNNTDIRTENTLTGQLFRISAHVSVAITVPFAQKTLPIWRNASSVQALTTGQTYASTTGVLGDEVDCADGSSGQPSNLVQLCPTPTGTQTSGANAAGTIYTTTVSLTAGFTLYRRSSGALIFNTGNWRGWQGVSRWSQSTTPGGTITAVDLNWQNALLAIIYDLGIVPTTLRSLRPGTETTPTDPATGAVSGGRSAIALAYGLRSPADGNFMQFMG